MCFTVAGFWACFLLASPALAFEVEATIQQVDAAKGVVVFRADGRDRTVKVDADAKILDGEGKPIAEGLKFLERLKVGTAVTLTVERAGDEPVLKAIRLGKKPATPAPALEQPAVDTSRLKPLTDMKPEEDYHAFKGGLYPGVRNERPAAHEKAGLERARKIQPLDRDGKPSADGKIVLLTIGFSNTVQCSAGFIAAAAADSTRNPKVVIVNGAVGGMSANMIQNPDDKGRGTKYWETVDERLKEAGVTRAQVQVIWLKETNPAPHEGGFPQYTQKLQAELTRIVQIFPPRFPNIRLVYLSSRTYGGWAKGRPPRGPGNSEPYSYETGFAVKWLIEQQLKGDPALNYDPTKGTVKAPWLSWGPYLWANGNTPRQDGFRFQLSDFRANDRMHHSPEGQKKMGQQLLRFFKNDPTTKEWFNKPNR